jgi:hypothetical protein
MAITGNGNASKEQVAKCYSNFRAEKLPKTLIVQTDWQQQFVIFQFWKSNW